MSWVIYLRSDTQKIWLDPPWISKYGKCLGLATNLVWFDREELWATADCKVVMVF